MSERVGLFVIGAQKAGTSSLFAYLQQHPALAASRVKETHFFDDEDLDWRDPPYAQLHAQFGPPDGRLRFEATPISSFWPPALGRIRQYNPAARLILVLRDPIGRAYSHWAMETRRHAETLPFRVAIRDGRQRLPRHAPADPAWRVFSYVERGHYEAQLRRLHRLFPAEQLLCLESESLGRDPAASLARVAAFLGLPPFPALERLRENQAPQPGGPSPDDVRMLRQVFRPELPMVERLIPSA